MSGMTKSNIKENLILYFRLIRWEDYLTFLQLVAGYIVGCSVGYTGCLNISTLVFSLIIFGPLLYGGIYILNDIVDVKMDALHSTKKERPLPSGKLSLRIAKIISFAQIFLALILSKFVGDEIFGMVIIFLTINIIYIFIAKQIPYIEFIFNSITHPLRFVFGFMLTGYVWDFFGFIIYFLGVNNLTIWKRIWEIEEENANIRPILKYYSKGALNVFVYLSLALLVVMSVVSSGINFYIGLFWIIYNTVVIYGYKKSSLFRRMVRFAFR